MDANDRPTSGGEPVGKSASLGHVLKTARNSRNLTLEQVSTELRIEARQLQALEQDDFERIGAPVFVKGYLRHYGQLLGLDYRNLLGLYYDQVDHHEVVVQPSRSIKLRDERQITVWIIAALVLAVLGVSFVIWWMNERNTANVVPTAVLEAAPRPMRATTDVDVPAVEGLAATEVAAADSDSGEPDVPAATESFAEQVLQVDVSFDQESWVEVTDARGGRLFYGLGAAGRHVVLEGEPPISVRLGNADGVRLAVEGVEYPIPNDARQGKVANFTLAPQESD